MRRRWVRVMAAAAAVHSAHRAVAATTESGGDQMQPPGGKYSDGGPPSQVITPWEVSARGPKGIDYERVRTQFQSEQLGQSQLDHLTAAYAATGYAGPVHPLLRRGIAFSHRDLDAVLDEVIAGRRAFLYTGRGPSAASMHVGHIIPFLLTAHLQRALHLPLVIQLTDDEKFLFRDTPLNSDKADKIVDSNVRDIIAFGFDPKLTFIFRNTAYMGRMYPTVVEIQRLLTLNAVRNTFGFADTDNIGKIAFPATQVAPCFASAFPTVLPMRSANIRCLIPCAIDQDPFFLLARGIASRMKRPKPALMHTRFLPALKGPGHKMSSSAQQHGVLLLSDTPDEIRRKMRSAFSGGSGTLEDLKRHGPNLDVDVAFQICRVFMPSDAALHELQESYTRGAVTTADVKATAAEVLINDVIAPWRARRDAITDSDVREFLSERSIFPPRRPGADSSGSSSTGN